MSIILTDVSYTYMPGTPYQRHALQHISLEIKKGEFIGVIGHTGSGKSTLMQQLCGLLPPSSGAITIDGVDIHAGGAQAKVMRRKAGMVFQYPEHQLFEETVYDDIAFGPRNMGLTEEETAARVRQAMAFVGLSFEQYRERSPFHLSGGQMRRVAIAGVIALQPEYLILDEPSAGLDPRGRCEIFAQILSLHRQTGMTVILVSHNMEEVARLAERIVVMQKGEIRLDGKPRTIFKNALEALQQAGVDAPPVTKLLRKLDSGGLAVDVGALTPEEATESVLQAMKGETPC